MARLRGVSLLFSVVALLVGCAGGQGTKPLARDAPPMTAVPAPATPRSAPGTGQDVAVLMGRSFVATSATERGQPRPFGSGTAARMRFQDGFLRYTAGCNLITGIVGLDGDRLALRDGAHTAVLCEGARGADEAWLEAFMQARPAWRLEGMELTLTEPNAALRLLDRSVAEPNRPLEGTNWLLRSVTFHGATTLLAADKQPFVRFRAGRFFGGTTCNDFSGDVAGGAGAFDLTGLQVGPVPCTEPMATVERGLLALFVGPAQLDLTGDELVLSKDDGSAGRFVAQADGY